MKLSIITINYNNADGLGTTMQSVFEQTSRDFEYILIDGGSSDGSKELIETNNSRFTYWVSEPDGGIFAAMNKGVRAANGEYLLFLNSGDKLHAPDVVAQVLPLLGTADFQTGDITTLGDENDVQTAPAEVTAPALLRFPLSHQATFIRRALLQERPYLEQYRLISDWEQMVYELIIRNRTYRPLHLIISDYDRTGVSSQAGHQARYEKERREAIESLFPPRIWQGLMGTSPIEQKILLALTKPDALSRDGKILRNLLKALPGDLLRALRRKLS